MLIIFNEISFFLLMINVFLLLYCFYDLFNMSIQYLFLLSQIKLHCNDEDNLCYQEAC